MALNKELITANTSLAGLSEEHISALVQLSLNDENTVIAKKVGEIHGAYEKDLAEYGFKKPEGWRSSDGKTQIYHYMKEEVYPKLNDLNKMKDQVKSANDKVKDLEQKIADGAQDETLRTQLKDAQKRFSDLQEQYTTDKSGWETKLTEKDKQVQSISINNEFDKALTAFKFKDESIIPTAVREAFVSTAKSKILGTLKPDFIDNGQGNKVLVFRNENGDVMNNPENGLNPYSAKDLLGKELKDILDVQRQATGTGANGQGSKNNGSSFQITNAKSQVEADDMIVSHLMQTGLIRGTVEFQEKHTEIRKDNPEIAKLPTS